MSASGVPDDDDAAEIDVVVTRDGPDVVDGSSDIEVRAGPPAAKPRLVAYGLNALLGNARS